MSTSLQLSIVSPVYHTGSMLAELVNRIVTNIPSEVISFEIILVDDGSKDDSWSIVHNICGKYPQVRGLRLSRNFGQHAAISAGLQNAGGEWIIVMDSDLQDQPELIPTLYEKAGNGHPIVLARRVRRNDPFTRKFASRVFYWLLARLSDISPDYMMGNFGIYHRQVIDAVVQMKETHRFFPMMVAWTGFPVTHVDTVHEKRAAGNSGYSFRKLVQLALQITLSYSDRPLRYIVKAGMLISLLSAIYAFVILVKYFTGSITVLGYTSLIVSIWFIGGLILFTLGIVGLYVGRTFEQTKGRPFFVVKEISE